ncbi:MAG: hypothetical protein AAGI08_05480 [Bacteroidota bacterium]
MLTLPPKLGEQLASDFLQKIDAYTGDQPNGDGASETKRTRYDLEPFPAEKRVAGLGEGTVEMADDFDDPLPDSFWLGKE